MPLTRAKNAGGSGCVGRAVGPPERSPRSSTLKGSSVHSLRKATRRVGGDARTKQRRWNAFATALWGVLGAAESSPVAP